SFTWAAIGGRSFSSTPVRGRPCQGRACARVLAVRPSDRDRARLDSTGVIDSANIGDFWDRGVDHKQQVRAATGRDAPALRLALTQAVEKEARRRGAWRHGSARTTGALGENGVFGASFLLRRRRA